MTGMGIKPMFTRYLTITSALDHSATSPPFRLLFFENIQQILTVQFLEIPSRLKSVKPDRANADVEVNAHATDVNSGNVDEASRQDLGWCSLGG